MTFYLVIDTNVIISSLIKHDSYPGKIIDLIISNAVIPVISEKIIKEYENVFNSTKFGFSKEDIQAFITYLKCSSVNIVPTPSGIKLIDLDDTVFYDAFKTLQSSNSVYLVTGNKKHFPSEDGIVTPHQM